MRFFLKNRFNERFLGERINYKWSCPNSPKSVNYQYTFLIRSPSYILILNKTKVLKLFCLRLKFFGTFFESASKTVFTFKKCKVKFHIKTEYQYNFFYLKLELLLSEKRFSPSACETFWNNFCITKFWKVLFASIYSYLYKLIIHILYLN